MRVATNSAPDPYLGARRPLAADGNPLLGLDIQFKIARLAMAAGRGMESKLRPRNGPAKNILSAQP